jgi:hypothetical protein
MDLADTTYILKQSLASVLEQKSPKNRLWLQKLTCVSYADALFSAKIAKAIVGALASRPIVLMVERQSVPLYNEAQLQKMGIVKLEVPGIFRYWAAKTVPTEILFRKKKQKKGQPDENAAQIFDLRSGWLELLPYEAKFLEGKLVLRGAAWLEKVRHETEHNILRIKNPEEWKQATRKERAKLEYCSLVPYDRIITIDLLRKNWMALTPKAEYYFCEADAEVKASTPKALSRLIIGVNARNRARYCSRIPKDFSSKAKN